MNGMDVLWFVCVGGEVLVPAGLYAPDELADAERVLSGLYGLPVRRMVSFPFLWECRVCAEGM